MARKSPIQNLSPVAGNEVGVKCTLFTAAPSHFAHAFHRLADDCSFNEYSKPVFDRVRGLRIGEYRCDLMELRLENAGGGKGVQYCPRLCGEVECFLHGEEHVPPMYAVYLIPVTQGLVTTKGCANMCPTKQRGHR